MRFRAKLFVQSSYTDLTDAQHTALDNALQAMETLPPLPKHRCTSGPRLTAEERETIRRLVAEFLNHPMPGGSRLGLDVEMKELWERFVPSIPFP